MLCHVGVHSVLINNDMRDIVNIVYVGAACVPPRDRVTKALIE